MGKDMEQRLYRGTEWPRALAALLGFIVLIVGSGCVWDNFISPSHEDAVVAGPRLNLSNHSHDLGRISFRHSTEYRIPFANTGDQPLQISRIDLTPGQPGGCT